MTKFPCGCEFDTIEYDQLFLKKNYGMGECPAVWELLQSGATQGIFQLESQLGKSWSKKLKPENWSHLAGMIAILRPGVLNAKDENNVSMAEHYVLRKNRQEPIEYIHPSLEPILSETFGIIIYQEQIISISQKLCGFSEEEADILRKGIGKKDTAVVAKCEEGFMSGAKSTGIISEDIAKQLWSNIVKSNRYLFNKSHSYEYGMNLYCSAYAKSHVPLQFLDSWLFFAKEKMHPKEEVNSLVNDGKLLDINVLVPDIRKSKKGFSIVDGNVIFGICDVKGIGDSQYEKIKGLIDQRSYTYGPTDTWLRLLLYVLGEMSDSAARGLICSGGFDFIGMARTKMLYEYDQFKKINEKELEWVLDQHSPETLLELVQLAAPRKKTAKDKEGSRPFGGTHTDRRNKLLLGIVDALVTPPFSLQDTPEWIAGVEHEHLGVSITCAKVDACDISSANCTCREFISGRSGNIVLAVEILRLKEYTTKNNTTMAFLTVSDGSASLDNVVVFSSPYSEFQNLLQQQNTVLLQGERDKNLGGFKVNRVVQI